MSTEQENFDDLLKSKLNEGEFSFNEANWDKAEALIIAADKKCKRKGIFFIFFIGLILGISIIIPFVDFGNKDEINNKILIEADSGVNNKVKAKIEKEKNSRKNEYVKENKNANRIGIKNEAVIAVKPEIKFENKDKEAADLSPNNTQEIVKEPWIYENKKGKTSKTNKVNGRSENKKNIKDIFITKTKKTSDSNEIDKDDLKLDKQNSINTKAEIMVANTKIDTTDVLTITNVAKDTAVVLKDITVKAKNDLIIITKNDSSTKTKQGFIFGIDAGANYVLGWKNNSTKEAAGFNAVFGINVTHFFTKTWSILLGLQYNSLAHLNYSNYTTNNMQYGFGYNQTKTIITPTIIRYLALPLKMQYWFNDKNSLSIGVNALYLLNTNSKVEAHTYSDFGTSATSVTTKTGYRDGLTTWDVQPAMAYKYCFMKGFSINTEVYYGLMNIKDNNVFAINRTEHNSGFKLTLSYIFIGRNRSVSGMKDYIK